jgi:cell division protein FtsW (lipid II flippase)
MTLGRNFDWVIALCAGILTLVGLSIVFSVSHSTGDAHAEWLRGSYFSRQLLWVGLGLFAMLVGFAVPFRVFETLAYAAYAACLALVVAPAPARGNPAVVCDRPLAIQPSEFTKVAVLLVARIWRGAIRSNRPHPDQLLILSGAVCAGAQAAGSQHRHSGQAFAAGLFGAAAVSTSSSFCPS